jgi:EAL domain-containing protein (putative c-di-GMP-specific phosphodiesterase class I)
MEKPFDIFGHFVQASGSMGAALAGVEHRTADQLVRDADFAMYRAKQNGRACYEIFDAHLEVCISSQQERERELRGVLEQRLFQFSYQPVFHLVDGRVEFFESLLRWSRADGAVDSFSDLMAVAEDTGLSIALGRESMEAACRQLRQWCETRPEQCASISLNLTRRQFYHPDMVAQMKKVLAATGADPRQLMLEVSEATLNENPDAAVAILQRLADCQVRVAMDDFGAGMASVNHLVRMPVSTVKLDAQLTAMAASSGRAQVLLEAILRLGRTLGIPMVAQGIDASEQLQALIQIGCTLGQGTLLARALDPAQALGLMAGEPQRR